MRKGKIMQMINIRHAKGQIPADAQEEGGLKEEPPE